jgi:hypothetical protein
MQPNPFHNPTAPGAPDPAPRPRDLLGCLVAYTCREFTPAGAPGNTEGYEGDDPRDRVTVDILLLETPNGPIAFGGNPETRIKPKPHYLTVAGPAHFEGAWISNSTIVKALKDNIGKMMLGRLVESEFGRRPINLMSVEGTPDMEKALSIYNALSFGQIQYNRPMPIPGAPDPRQQAQAAPAQPPMPPQYAPSPVAPQPTAWTWPPPPAPALPVEISAMHSVGMYGGTPQNDPRFGSAPQQPDPGPAAVMAAFPGAQAVPPPGQVPQPPAPPVAPQLPPHLSAAGWTSETWATLTPAQQAQVLSQTPVA